MKKMTQLKILLTYEQKMWLAKKAEEDGSTCSGVLRALLVRDMKEQR